jgi:hypothetical protein
MKALPPIDAPRFRWWADELASAVAAGPAPSPRRSPKAKLPKKKRSISDLFAAAPPLAEPLSDDEQTEAEDDEALLAIVRRAKEEKKRKRRLQEEEWEDEAAAAASADGSGGREAEGNFETRKVRGPAQTHLCRLPVYGSICNDIVCYYSCVFLDDFSFYF